LDASEFCTEIESFKHQAQTLLSCVESTTPLELCQLIQDYALSGCYPNIEIALQFFWLCLLLLRHVKGASVN
jgi:hypothetical protein